MTAGMKLLMSLIDSADLNAYVKMGLIREYFRADEAELFDFVSTHMKSHGALPKRVTVEANLKGLMLPENVPEPPSYYLELVKKRYVHTVLKETVLTIQEDLNVDDPYKGLDTLTSALVRIQKNRNATRMVDFANDGLDVIKAEYKRKKKQIMEGSTLKFGWKTFDAMSGGLGGGDVVSVVGRMGMGKTYVMLHASNNAWKAGLTPLVVSMEMKPIGIMQRAGAMLFRKPITQLKNSALVPKQEQNLIQGLQSMQGKPPYWIIEGNLTATVDDIIMMCHQLNPGIVFIDGAYLLRGRDPRQKMWERTMENAERIKSEIAEARNIPVVMSYQFNREAVKNKRKGERGGLEDIAYSDAIGQLSSVVMGLFQSESVETLNKRRIEILKGRNGESGSFEINWNFDLGPNYMDFTEVEELSLEDLKYVG